MPPTSPLQSTTYGDSSLNLRPTVYKGSSSTLSSTRYQAPPRSEPEALPIANQDFPPPALVKESRPSLYNPAADRIPRADPKPSPVTLNEDRKRTTVPWKSPDFPDLTCGHRAVIPQAFFEQEETLIKRLKTAEAQEKTKKEPKETSLSRLATIEEEGENPEEDKVTDKDRKDTSAAEKGGSEEQRESSDAQEETCIERLTTTAEEEKKESSTEKEEEESPEQRPEREEAGSLEREGGEESSGQEERTRETEEETLAAQQVDKEQAERHKAQDQSREYHYIVSEACENMEGNTKVPQPGPAKLGKNSDLDQWLECAKKCQYLPEAIMKKLCEMVKELLMEGRLRVREALAPNIQSLYQPRSLISPS